MASDQTSALALRARLVLAAFLMLFVELALIRWLGANVLYLAYFSNVVLLGSFLGIGLGFLWTSRSEVAALPVRPARARRPSWCWCGVLDVKVGVAGEQLIFFNLDSSGPPRWVVLPVVFVAVADRDAVPRRGRGPVRSSAWPTSTRTSSTSSAASWAWWRSRSCRWPSSTRGCGRRSPRSGSLVAIAPGDRPPIVLAVAPLAVFLGVLVVESNEADTVWTPYYKVGIEPIGDTGRRDRHRQRHPHLAPGGRTPAPTPSTGPCTSR